MRKQKFETKDGIAILYDECFDLKVTTEREVMIRTGMDKQFKSLKRKVPEGMMMSEKYEFLILLNHDIKTKFDGGGEESFFENDDD